MSNTTFGNVTTVKFSDGTWRKRTYDDDDNVIFYQDNDMWVKVEYDKENKTIQYEDSNGNYWNENMNISNPYIETMQKVSNTIITF